MGNHRFRLSAMMPNAWFYKLRDMSKLKNKQNPTKKNLLNPTLNPRKSSYHARMDNKLCHSPRNPNKSRRPTIYFQEPDDNCFASPDEGPTSESDCCYDSSVADIVIDVDSFTEFNILSEPDLPPILTKPGKSRSPTRRAKTSPARKSVSRSGGVRIRGNGRRIPTKKREAGRRKSVKWEKKGMFYSESFAIVKASFDPEKDFRDSMMEMIVENNIREPKDLEELLACYLSLNSNQYHDLIIRAFEQIWFNMPGLNF